MSRESLHTVAEGEEGNVRPLSPELFRASVLERLLEGIEKVSAGQNNLDKRLNDRLTDVTAGQNNLDKRLTDGQDKMERRFTDLFEGQTELSRNQSELSRSHFELSGNQAEISRAQSELQRDQRSLLNRIESLEADRRVSKEVSTTPNPDFSEPQPKVAELSSAAALPLETFVRKPIIEESHGFEPETLGPRRSTRLKDRPQPDYRFPVKPGFRKETGARPKDYSSLSNISGTQISLQNVTSPLHKPPVVAHSRGGDGGHHIGDAGWNKFDVRFLEEDPEDGEVSEARFRSETDIQRSNVRFERDVDVESLHSSVDHEIDNLDKDKFRIINNNGREMQLQRDFGVENLENEKFVRGMDSQLFGRGLQKEINLSDAANRFNVSPLPLSASESRRLPGITESNLDYESRIQFRRPTSVPLDAQSLRNPLESEISSQRNMPDRDLFRMSHASVVHSQASAFNPHVSEEMIRRQPISHAFAQPDNFLTSLSLNRSDAPPRIDRTMIPSYASNFTDPYRIPETYPSFA